MTDYLDSLKDIKKELIKEQKLPTNKENSKDFESVAEKQKRLQDELGEFIKGCDILK